MLEVKFSISHRGCWTHDMMQQFPDLRGSVISMYEDRNGSISILAKVREKSKDRLLEFIKWCENYSLISSMTVFDIDENKDHYTALFLMVGQYDRIQKYSILNTLVSNKCIPYGFQYFGDGEEYWRIIAVNKKHLTEVFNKLKELGPVELISVKTLKNMPIFMDSPEINLLSNSLTDKQIDSLLTAYEKGYYSIPRKATLDDLANETGVNKSTFSEHIRRAENKFVEHFINLMQDSTDITRR